MAIPATDIQVGQPVRTLNNADVIAAIADATTPTQTLAVDSAGHIGTRLYDASGTGITSQLNGTTQHALDVGINVGGVQIDPRLAGQYNSTLPTVASGAFVAPQTDSSGRTMVVSPTAANFNATVVQGAAGSAGAAWFTTDAADGSVAPGAAASKSMLGGGIYNSAGVTLTNGQQAALQLDATGALKIRLLTDTDRISADMNVAGAPVTASNPIPVTITSTTPGTPINNYFASTAVVAAGSTDTHTYTITTGKTFNGKKFWASGTGRMRIDVNTVIGGTTATIFTAFNSVSDPNITIDMDEFFVPASGTTAQIQIVRYNEDNKPFGMYSTISGTEN